LRGGIGDGEEAVFFVDDDERVVFPNDAQVGAVKGGAAALVADEDDVAGSERRVEVSRDAPVNPYLSVAKQALDGASAAVGQVGEEEGEIAENFFLVFRQFRPQRVDAEEGHIRLDLDQDGLGLLLIKKEN